MDKEKVANEGEKSKTKKIDQRKEFKLTNNIIDRLQN